MIVAAVAWAKGWPVGPGPGPRQPRRHPRRHLRHRGAELAIPATLPLQLPNATLVAVLPNGEFLAIGTGTNPTTGSTELVLTRYFQ